ncbi:hypothetical protein QJQ45_008421 [Haematococcus lacustris]|nr:hypothetical protein QJQ45_008421 [Haematococcus lacustris]
MASELDDAWAVRRGRALLASPRVGGVGVGIFLILFFMCAVFAIVFGVLAASPKGEPPPRPATGYDQTAIPLAALAVVMGLGVVGSGAGLLIFQAAAQVYARPLPPHSAQLGCTKKKDEEKKKKKKKTLAEPKMRKRDKATPLHQDTPGDLGKWVDRDCNAALTLQRAGESKWRPLELCRWPHRGAASAKGREYPALGFKKLRDQAPKALAQQPVAQ